MNNRYNTTFGTVVAHILSIENNARKYDVICSTTMPVRTRLHGAISRPVSVIDKGQPMLWVGGGVCTAAGKQK